MKINNTRLLNLVGIKVGPYNNNLQLISWGLLLYGKLLWLEVGIVDNNLMEIHVSHNERS